MRHARRAGRAVRAGWSAGNRPDVRCGTSTGCRAPLARCGAPGPPASGKRALDRPRPGRSTELRSGPRPRAPAERQWLHGNAAAESAPALPAARASRPARRFYTADGSGESSTEKTAPSPARTGCRFRGGTGRAPQPPPPIARRLPAGKSHRAAGSCAGWKRR